MSLIEYPYSSLISQILRGAIIILCTGSARRCERPVPWGGTCTVTDPHPPVSGQQALQQHHTLEGGDVRGSDDKNTWRINRHQAHE